MFCFQSSIPVDHHLEMAKSVPKAKQKNPNLPHHCDQSRSALIDVVILIAVICAFGFLLYPYVKILGQKTADLSEVVIEEVLRAPLVFGCLGLSIVFAVTALVVITVCTDNRCSKAGCRGLRKAAEFDIQLETEDALSRSNLQLSSSSYKKGLFELPRDHHRELEAELKKMAPPNGRAVLMFRARCGCSLGRMEVPGPRKSRKVRK
ncbi:hypothetical protein SASPL_117482 [Salvia splendens]|uniref:Uncharacterized protein n=1 Tax=Salvia splendens TaxID=180675 RepID=A0A8X8XV23_SALSN|nr:uncharacterized protein At5g19025-like [Salvia splendens]KAG6420936.1 hypothetical protein SASPL_117482 [Salvia splendens]